MTLDQLSWLENSSWCPEYAGQREMSFTSVNCLDFWALLTKLTRERIFTLKECKENRNKKQVPGRNWTHWAKFFITQALSKINVQSQDERNETRSFFFSSRVKWSDIMRYHRQTYKQSDEANQCVISERNWTFNDQRYFYFHWLSWRKTLVSMNRQYTDKDTYWREKSGWLQSHQWMKDILSA